MSEYRRLWWATTLAIGVPSALLGLTFSPTPGVVAAVIVLGLAAGAKVVPGAAAVRWWRDLSCAAVLAFAAGPALGAATLPLLMVLVVSSPSMVALVGEKLATGQPTIPAAAAQMRARDASSELEELGLTSLDSPALCELWRSSFVRLKLASSPHERVVVARLRARLLDEMERRDSGGFAAWLSRGPSAASQPRWMAAPSPENDVRDD
jgi:hypothetical protein